MMENEYIPEVGSKMIPEHVEEKLVTGLVNRPDAGTRLRVTLPGTETVLVGTVTNQLTGFPAIHLNIEGGQGFYGNDIMLWVESGWKFEVLPTLDAPVEVLPTLDAPVEADPELVAA